MLGIQPHYGIITACDSGYFGGFATLALSVAGQAPITLFDLGLEDKQIEWCQEHKIKIRTPEILIPTTMYFWQTWCKPWFILQSPYQKTLWLDGDCIASYKNPIVPLFAKLKEQAFAVRHRSARRYELKCWTGEKFVIANPNFIINKYPVTKLFHPDNKVNAGVIGIDLNRDRELMDHWTFIIKEAEQDEEVRNNLPYYDEGALHWAMQRWGNEDFVVHDSTWNNFVSINHRLTNKTSPYDILQSGWVRGAAKHNLILHMLGPAFTGEKYWFYWPYHEVFRPQASERHDW